MDARITNLRASEAALVDIMERARRIDDVLAVQLRLEDVRGQIEQLEAQRSHLADQAALSTLSVTWFTPVAAVTAAQAGWDPGTSWTPPWRRRWPLQGLAGVAIWLAVVAVPLLGPPLLLAMLARPPAATPPGIVAGSAGDGGAPVPTACRPSPARSPAAASSDTRPDAWPSRRALRHHRRSPTAGRSRPMRFALMTEPQQGYSYQDLLDAALAAEEAGFETFFRSDHYTSFPGRPVCPPRMPGRRWQVSPATRGASAWAPWSPRSPSASRAPCQDRGHRGRDERRTGGGRGGCRLERGRARPAGHPLPGEGRRVDRLEESLRILRGLWDEPDGWTFEGRHYQVRGSLFRPRGRRPHLIVGGTGKPRSIRLAAPFADEYDISSSTPAEVRDINARLDEACEHGP